MKNVKYGLYAAALGFAAVVISFFFDGIAMQIVSFVRNPFFDYLFGWFTQFGSLFFVLLVMMTLFLWEENKKKWVIPLWTCWIVTFVAVTALKLLVQRDRPDGLVMYPFPFWNVVDYSFPSMHAALGFCVVPLLDKNFPSLKWFFVLFAVLVALSRIYFNFHYLSDVVAGCVVGIFIGEVMVYNMRRSKNESGK